MTRLDVSGRFVAGIMLLSVSIGAACEMAAHQAWPGWFWPALLVLVVPFVLGWLLFVASIPDLQEAILVPLVICGEAALFVGGWAVATMNTEGGVFVLGVAAVFVTLGLSIYSLDDLELDSSMKEEAAAE